MRPRNPPPDLPIRGFPALLLDGIFVYYSLAKVEIAVLSDLESINLDEDSVFAGVVLRSLKAQHFSIYVESASR